MPQIRNEKRYIDISPDWALQPGVFPGDTQYSRKVLMDFDKNHLELSSFESTLHIGAHADAPCHYSKDAGGLETRDLNIYMGEAQVIEVKIDRNKPIKPSDFDCEIQAQRVLFKTQSFSYEGGWSDDFNFFHPDTISMLASKNVVLVGIDTPSVDSANSKVMLAHKEIFKNNLAILEGIDLRGAEPGIYELIALPLPIKGVDATPVRAILVEDSKC